LAKHNIPLIRQAPYSPDMAPCDFWLFPKLKMLLKGTRFESRRHYAERNSPAVHDSTRSFPEMLPAMAGPLEEMCALPTRLL